MNELLRGMSLIAILFILPFIQASCQQDAKTQYHWSNSIVNDSTLNLSKYDSSSLSSQNLSSDIQVSHPEDLTFQINTEGHNITWTVECEISFDVLIFQNGTRKSSVHNPPFPLVVNVGNLTAGRYNYTIFVRNVAGNTDSDSVWVTVSAAPELPQFPFLYSIAGFGIVTLSALIVVGMLVKWKRDV